MSESEDSATDRSARAPLAALEEAVGRLLEEHAEASRRAREAEARVATLEALLRSFGQGEINPSELQTTITRLTDRNRELRGRVEEGRAGVERLLARLRFLEEQG